MSARLTNRDRIRVVAVSAIFFLILYTTSDYDFPSWGKFKSKQFLPLPEASSTTNLTILLWRGNLWYRNTFQNGRKPIALRTNKECGECFFTNDKKDFERADGVIFHSSFISKNGSFPDRSRRSPGQLYAFWSGENPYYTKVLVKPGDKTLKDFDEDFNITITYRTDSDITRVYGCWKNLRPEAIDFSRKKAVAIFVASDCHRIGAKMRFDYARALMASGLKLDGYGKCFGKRYEGDFARLLEPYKFYLAFENSILCREYITEKLWKNAFMYGLVPVVWGPSKADVERVAPPNSFIHVDDFRSVHELASYLTHLDQNDDAYKEYFQWRARQPTVIPANEAYDCPTLSSDQPKMTSGVPPVACALCRFMKARHIEPEQYFISSLTGWWYGTEALECFARTLSAAQKVMLKTEHNFIP